MFTTQRLAVSVCLTVLLIGSSPLPGQESETAAGVEQLSAGKCSRLCKTFRRMSHRGFHLIDERPGFAMRIGESNTDGRGCPSPAAPTVREIAEVLLPSYKVDRRELEGADATFEAAVSTGQAWARHRRRNSRRSHRDKAGVGAHSSGWSEDDWNGDGLFGTGGLSSTFEDGGYDQRELATASAVPEPASILIVMGSLSGIGFCHGCNG